MKHLLVSSLFAAAMLSLSISAFAGNGGGSGPSGVWPPIVSRQHAFKPALPVESQNPVRHSQLKAAFAPDSSPRHNIDSAFRDFFAPLNPLA